VNSSLLIICVLFESTITIKQEIITKMMDSFFLSFGRKRKWGNEKTVQVALTQIKAGINAQESGKTITIWFLLYFLHIFYLLVLIGDRMRSWTSLL